MSPKSVRSTVCAVSSSANGFTLVEMLIASLVTGIMLLAVYTSHQIQQSAFSNQREMARMEANLRAAIHLIKSDLRNAGRGDQMTGILGPGGGFDIVAESRRYDPAFNGGAFPIAAIDMANGIQGLTVNMAIDVGDPLSGNDDGEADPMNVANIRTITYRIWDSNNDGRTELHRLDSMAPPGVVPPAGTIVADDIVDMSIAFAYNLPPLPGQSADDEVDRIPVAGGIGNVIWAVDDDAALGLETNLDNNNTGDIDFRDDGDGDDLINIADGGLGTQIPMQRVRAARIWLMARSGRPISGYQDNLVHQVGHRVFRPAEIADDNNDNTDQFRYLVLESSVNLRNRERLDAN